MGARRCDGAFGFVSEEDRAYAINTVETVTWLAGRPDYFDELGEAGKHHDLFGSISRSRSSRVFDWLMAALKAIRAFLTRWPDRTWQRTSDHVGEKSPGASKAARAPC